MMLKTPNDRRAYALRAALAVTLGSIGACGTDPTDGDSDAGSDAGHDAGGDVVEDAVADVAVDAIADTSVCAVEVDDLCPDSCTELTDGDCCDTFCGGPGWGYLSAGTCNCAVEGPFAPPSFDRRRAVRRTRVHAEAA